MWYSKVLLAADEVSNFLFTILEKILFDFIVKKFVELIIWIMLGASRKIDFTNYDSGEGQKS